MPDTNKKDEPKRSDTEFSPFDARIWMWMLFFFAVFYLFEGNRTRPEVIAYSDFKASVQRGRVEAVTFKGDQIHGNYQSTAENPQFLTVIPNVGDDKLLPLLEEFGVEVRADSMAEPRWLQLLLGFLPWFVLMSFLVYSTLVVQRRMSGGGGMFGFAKSRARLFEHEDNEVGYDDVAGLDAAKAELVEIIEFLKAPERFRKLGAKIPRGILLMGPPGTGKTMLAKATAHEAGVPFFSVSGSEFIEMYVGVGASRVRDMFSEARKRAPSLIFIDEIDSVGRVRGTGVGGGHDEREQTLNQILAEMDGFKREEAIVVLAATNRPDVLDPALLRPGRFDRKVTLELPQAVARKEILLVHTRQIPLANDVDLDETVAMTVGFSGADLANLVNEAALMAARKDESQITREDFTRAHDRIVMGSERPDLMNPSERRRTATHESGHALSAYLLSDSDPLHKVSIIPRGRSLGVTEQLPSEDRHNYDQAYLETRLAVLLSGRAAEKLILGSVSSGAADDLTQATHLARMMVTQWGMSDAIGPVHFKSGSEHPFLGYELTQERDFSEDTAAAIDKEVHRIIFQAQETASQTLTRNQGALEQLIDHLTRRETLTRSEVDEILQGIPQDKTTGHPAG